jgi:hypothetical protein
MQSMWETNFIPNIKDMEVKDDLYTKGPEVGLVQFEAAGNALIGHIADWPAGLYQKAHYHGPGAVLMILKSEGYTLIWPKDLGIHPYENGEGDQVVEIKWKERSVFGPPGGWFHQHFNTGNQPARQLAVRYGSRIHHIGFKIAAVGKTDGVYISVKEGGTMIDYPDEDPEIPRKYNRALKKNGVVSKMDAFTTVPS